MNEQKFRDKGYILAAGGVLERRDETAGVQIALVHRKRYRHSDGSDGDWSLPKGKCKDNETFEETALREVKEETGYSGTIVGPGYPSLYRVGEKHKLVMFFPMVCKQRRGHPDESEIREVVWLTREEALSRMTYDSERTLVQQALRDE
jgi:8-oxo-dGTP pyrophosphatase MutT (NUDIX family)